MALPCEWHHRQSRRKWDPLKLAMLVIERNCRLGIYKADEYPCESREMVFDAYDRAFALFSRYGVANVGRTSQAVSLLCGVALGNSKRKKSLTMGKTTALRRELKRRFYPCAESLDYEIDKSAGPNGVDFRRITPERIDVFDLQWEKYGRPRFVVNFGRCPPAGVIHYGEFFAPEKVLSYMGVPSGQLKPGSGPDSRFWFRQDAPFLRRLLLRQPDRPAAEVVDQLLDLFSELEDWFHHDRPGAHMKFISYPWHPKANEAGNVPR